MHHSVACCVAFFGLTLTCAAQETQPVGPAADGGHVVTTAQLVRPAGQTLEFAGRPVDLALSPDKRTLFVKDNRGLLAIDVETWTLRQELKFEGDGGSMCGIAVSPDGRRVYATTASDDLIEASVEEAGTLKVTRKISLPGPDTKSNSFPCGVAISGDGKTAYVCLSRNNTLGVIDLEAGALKAQIDVGVAPYAVKISPDGREAYVTNWGGRRAREGDKTADSSGTKAVIDERGIAASGTASVVDLPAKKQTAEIAVGLSPCGLELGRGGKTLYVANANSDTVSFIDLAKREVVETLTVRPDEKLPFGSMPNGLALVDEGNTLLVTLAGNNALAVIHLFPTGGESERIAGFVPTGWYPGAVVDDGRRTFIANIKGVGSRSPRPDRKGWNSHWHRGSITKVSFGEKKELAAFTQQVLRDARVPQVLKSRELADKRNDAKPVAVPANVGQPSVFEHVLYVIKENRTYDQVFGDMGRGNSDPSLCIYGRQITPNQHALADRYVLLDNFYCNGVLSADGHSWATEGNVTPYLERSFGGFNRSYTFGDDPLTFSSSGFVWDHVLARGLSFRNYGEFEQGALEPPRDYFAVYKDYLAGTPIKFRLKIGNENVRRYSCTESPGWNMDIPDQVRADAFLKELAEFEKSGQMPSFMILYLPNDHTSGTAEGKPTPRSLVADNDLALGRVVEGLSRSRFWPRTCIFVIEDDPQDGFDHVDGHRSTCLVISPYTRRSAVVSEFYNQASVIHTIERIFGISPQNQLYAMAPLMTACFAGTPEFSPFAHLPSNIPLGQPNQKVALLSPAARELALQSAALPLDRPDRADEDTLNRILWHDARGVDAHYPVHLAGAHGSGLAALGLRLEAGTGSPRPNDDDDD